MSARSIGLLRVLLPLLLCVCAGCAKETVEGDTRVFTYESWVPIAVAAVSVAMFGVGVMFRSKGWAWALLILGPLLGVVIAPGLIMEKVTLDPDGFALKVGFWFMPTEHALRYDEIKQIDYVSETSRDRKGRKSTSYYLLCRLKTGGDAKVPVGTLMKEGPSELIMQTAEGKGVPVVIFAE